MTYKNYSDTDFIKDEFFVKWVSDPDEETDLFWKRWIANHPEKRREIEVAKKFIQNLQYADEYSLPEKMFSQIHENIIRFDKSQQNQRLSNKRRGKWWLAAAAITLLFVSVGIFRYNRNHKAETAIAVTYITKETINGVKHTISLPDGTKVKLNSGSSLRYSENFSAGKREVFLEGEAFFEVTEDRQNPFIVRSKDIVTQVLGTSFNVRTYKNERLSKVAVITGKVKVSSANVKPVLLTPKQMAVYDQNARKLITREFDFTEEVGWKEGILNFMNEPLEQVFRELEVWYGVKIQLEDQISLTDVYKGEFKNETLDNVLSAIGYTSGFQYHIEGKNVFVYQSKK
ncbi:DUF4974 domain-containing protein [Fulvivirgaceae bacterium BMA12]|uniref:DUF4974 domain-containing protein n=1 Tax=Agaribacillus aureus TaxID=3051825 RepID=A0ABT8LDF9_9BACT|nr:DUF4974 domain-containing protein [Fulvivirgaceae bacterium BMA12]